MPTFGKGFSGTGRSVSKGASKGGAPSFSPKAVGAFSGTSRDAPIGTTSSQGAGPKGGAIEGLSQEKVLQHQVLDIVGDTPEKRADLTPRTVQNALNDPKGFTTKKNAFGYTMAEELGFARREGFRDIDQQGKYGGSLATFDGLAAHQDDNTPKHDRSIAANPIVGQFMKTAVGLAPAPFGTIASAAMNIMDPEFLANVNKIFTSAGPTVTVEDPLKKIGAKKGGRTRKKVSRTKKNYAKGGGVRSAKY